MRSFTQGRQLRGFRGLFSKGSKCSVDTHFGVLPRKRSLSNHLLRRTASAPAKGRKKTKMVLSETSLDKEESSNGDLKQQATEKTAGPRIGLQHRPASMPLERLLQGRLTVSSSEQDGPDTGADTIIGELNDQFSHTKYVVYFPKFVFFGQTSYTHINQDNSKAFHQVLNLNHICKCMFLLQLGRSHI